MIWFEEMVLRVVQVFRIFYRTVTDWESDNRHALEYVLHLLEYYIRHENIRKDWLETIDDYLKMTRRDILTTKGRVTHKQAIDKAHKEYGKYWKKQDELLSPVEQHFIESIKELEALE